MCHTQWPTVPLVMCMLQVGHPCLKVWAHDAVTLEGSPLLLHKKNGEDTRYTALTVGNAVLLLWRELKVNLHQRKLVGCMYCVPATVVNITLELTGPSVAARGCHSTYFGQPA